MVFSFAGTGAIAFLYENDGVKIELVGWKGNKSVRAYVAKNDRIHYLRLLGADTSKYEKNKFAEQRNVEALNNADKESPQDETPCDEDCTNEKETKNGDNTEEMT